MTSHQLLRVNLLVIILHLIEVGLANPLPFKFANWLNENLSPGNRSFQAEVHCYSLPYGGIGFVSHILTYWTVVWLGLGSRPLWPSKKLNQKKWDIFLGLLSLIPSVFFAILTVVRCRDRWQFMLIAVWKTTLSLTLSAIGLHQGFRLVQAAETINHGALRVASIKAAPFWWTMVYGLGTIVGLVGTLSIIAETFSMNSSVRAIVFAFSGIICMLEIVLVLASCAYSWSRRGREQDSCLWIIAMFPVETALYFVFLLGLLAVFLSDWVLSAITGNWSGAPSSDVAWLYWPYFIAKRIPLFSI